jgi:hypothetical protein
MLLIRKEQMEVMRGGALRLFEDEMIVHLAEFSPPLFRAVKEDQMRKAIRMGMNRADGIRMGMNRADGYGFNFRGPVRLYLELMLLFGSFFDTDPQYPWAGEILTDRDSGPQMQRAEWLYERTRDYRQQVNGPQDAYTLSALRTIAAFARQPLQVSASDFVPSMIREMAQVYPQKTAYVGDEQLEMLIDEGTSTAKIHGFSTVRGAALTVVLMFAFGHGCCGDPLYPWIARTVNNERITDSEARAMRLEKKALTWLDHVLGYFDKGGQT